MSQHDARLALRHCQHLVEDLNAALFADQLVSVSIDLPRKPTRAACMPTICCQHRKLSRPNQSAGILETVSRQTVAWASVPSAGGGSGGEVSFAKLQQFFLRRQENGPKRQEISRFTSDRHATSDFNPQGQEGSVAGDVMMGMAKRGWRLSYAAGQIHLSRKRKHH